MGRVEMSCISQPRLATASLCRMAVRDLVCREKQQRPQGERGTAQEQGDWMSGGEQRQAGPVGKVD